MTRILSVWQQFWQKTAVSAGLIKGLSRRSLSEITGIPEPTLERFETRGKISLEAFLKLVVEFGWFDEMSAIMNKSKFTTGEELETINKNQGRKKGR